MSTTSPESTGFKLELLPQADLTRARIGDLLTQLSRCIRARQMYAPNNPTYGMFVNALKASFRSVFEFSSSLSLTVEENALRWNDELFVLGEGRDSLAFLFYKDGIRFLTFLVGFEDELERFLDVLYNLRRDPRQDNDLVALLWEQEFASFQYSHLDVLVEGLVIPEGMDLPTGMLDLGQLLTQPQDASPTAGTPAAGGAVEEEPPKSLSAADFEGAFFFLSGDEISALQRQLEGEFKRDVRADVLKSLLDLLEDPLPARQEEVLRVLRQLLPSLLGRGAFSDAAMVLRELDEILSSPSSQLVAEARSSVDQLLAEMSEPRVLGQIVHLLEDGVIETDAAELFLFFRRLRPEAVWVLLYASEGTRVARQREIIEGTLDRLVAESADHIVSLLASPEMFVAIGACRVVGRARLTAAARQLTALLARPEPEVRRAAVEALAALHSASGVEGLQQALEDSERDVRIVAVRGLAAIRHSPSRARLLPLLESRALLEADLTEKIAFFEAYGTIGGPDSVPYLDQMLNGKKLLGRRHPAELRACAALGLARASTPQARAALERASGETDPVVRSAVLRALRQEGTA